MVFKTTGAEGFLGNMALWGKSFQDIGNIFKSSWGKSWDDFYNSFDGFDKKLDVTGGKIKAFGGAIGNGLKDVFTKTKDSPFELMANGEATAWIGKFAKATDKGAAALQDFNISLEDPSMKAYLSTVDAGGASVEGYTKFVNESNTALKATSLSSKAAAVGMKALSIAGNMLVGIGIGLAINALIKGLDYLVNYQEKLVEKANALSDEYKKLQSDVTALQEQLTANQTKIDEINKNPLDIIGKDTLKTLQMENAELERQLQLAQQLANKKQKEAGEAAYKALTNDDTGFGEVRHSELSGASRKQGTYGEAAQYNIEKTKELNDELLALDSSSKKYEKSKADLERQIGYENDELVKNIEKIGELKSQLDLTEPSQKALYDSLTKTQDAYLALQTLSPDLNTFEEIFDSKATEEQQQKLLELARQGELTAESFKENYGMLSILFESIGINIDDVIIKLKNMGAESAKTVPEIKEIVSAFDNLKDISDHVTNIKNIGKALDEVSSNGIITSATLLKLKDDLKATDEQLISLQNAFKSGNEDKVKNQLAQIAQAYINTATAAKNLTEQEKIQLATEFESIGVKNALAVVEESVTTATLETKRSKFEATIASINFITATNEEISALENEANACGATASAIETLTRKREASKKMANLRSWEVSGGVMKPSIAKEYHALKKIVEEPFDTSNLFNFKKTANNLDIDWDKILDTSGVKSATKDIDDSLKQAMSSAQSAINNLLKMTMDMINQQYDNEKKAIEKLKDAEKDRYDTNKKALEKAYEQEKKNHDLQKQAIEDAKDGAKAVLDLKLKALQAEKDAYYWNKELSKQNKSVADLEADIATIGNDDSDEGLAKKRELEAQLAAEKEKLADMQFDHSNQLQEDALNNEYNKFEEMQSGKLDLLEQESNLREEQHQAELDRMETEYNLYIDQQDEKLNAINEYTSLESNIRAEAIKMIENKNSGLYQKLLEWNQKYGDSLDSTVINAWGNAYDALGQFNDGQLNVLDILNELSLKMNDFEQSTKNAADAVQNLAQQSANVKPPNSGLADGDTQKSVRQEIQYWNKQMSFTDSEQEKKEIQKYINELKAKLANNTYHVGGVVTKNRRRIDESLGLKPDEQMVKAKIGETILSPDEPQNAKKLITDFINSNLNLNAFTGINENQQLIANAIPASISGFAPSKYQQIAEDRSIQFTQGDIIIQGDASKQNVMDIKKITDDIINRLMLRINRGGVGNMKVL